MAERLAVEKRQLLFATILSSRSLFTAAKMRLRLEYFTQADDTVFRAVWAAAVRAADSSGVDVLFGSRDQAWNVMDAEAKSLFRESPALYPLDFWDQVFGDGGFLKWVYGDCKPDQFHEGYGNQLLAEFIRERGVNDFWQKLSREASGGVVSNMSQVLTDLMTREAELSCIDDDPVASGAPRGWLPPPSRRRPTGMVWLDKFLRGGHSAPEVYGLLGAFGSGKTTFGLQLLTSVAELEILYTLMPSARADAGIDDTDNYQMGHCYYFHYEMPEPEIRKKLWSGAAGIDFDRIERLGNKGFELSSSNNLSPEELGVLAELSRQNGAAFSGADFPGEKERLDRALKKLSVNLWQVDCTGNGKNPLRGTGYIPEISAILAAERRKGRRIALVVIDYAGACVERHTQDKDQIYQLLSQFGRKCEEQISVPFDTPVWVLHQLAGAENARTAATKQTHANASGSKRFGENCWFCFNIGTSDEKSGCRYFTCSKARRSDLGAPPILKIAGGFNRLLDVSRDFAFDRSGKVKPRAESRAPSVVSSDGQRLNPDTGNDLSGGGD